MIIVPCGKVLGRLCFICTYKCEIKSLDAFADIDSFSFHLVFTILEVVYYRTAWDCFLYPAPAGFLTSTAHAHDVCVPLPHAPANSLI